jgi:hypothetical protein
LWKAKKKKKKKRAALSSWRLTLMILRSGKVKLKLRGFSRKWMMFLITELLYLPLLNFLHLSPSPHTREKNI